jgi:hypothetical protein
VLKRFGLLEVLSDSGVGIGAAFRQGKKSCHSLMWKGSAGCVIYRSRSFTASEIWSEIAGTRPKPRAMYGARNKSR